MIRDILSRLELSQTGAAIMLDVDPRTMRRWCGRDGRPPTVAVVALAAVAEIADRTGEPPGEVIARLTARPPRKA